MTRFRIPCGWSTRREPGKRPPLEGTWLDPANAPEEGVYDTHAISYRYWLKIHWATPPWVTNDMWSQVRALYDAAGPDDHVDHIVPLKHKLVCGLHVPWNLRVIHKRENMVKSNNWWPDCPDHLCPVKNLPPDMFGHSKSPHQMRLL